MSGGINSLLGSNCVGATDPVAPVTGQWYNVTLTVSGTTATEFVNGESVATTTVNSNDLWWGGSSDCTGGTGGESDYNNPCEIYLGYDGYGNEEYFDGSIAGVGVWSRTLTPDEVSSLYAGGNGLSYPYASDIYTYGVA